ncbi:MAG: 16S rRNA (guanine(527)-N(7))-methyltransferase RsmG [Elusimicrobiota bacterium]
MEEKIKSLIKSFSIEISEDGIKKLSLFALEVLNKNKIINLISKNDEQKIISRHIVDSIMILRTGLIKPTDKTLLDIGSGGGFPGVCLSIIYPEISITLAEKKEKKSKFLIWIKQFLKLENIQIVNKEITGNEKQRYDIITQRAAGKLEFLYKIAMPLLNPHGIFISWLSPEMAKKINNNPYFIYNYNLGDERQRCISAFLKE